MKIYEVCPNSSISKDVKHVMFSVTRNVHFYVRMMTYVMLGRKRNLSNYAIFYAGQIVSFFSTNLSKICHNFPPVHHWDD